MGLKRKIYSDLLTWKHQSNGKSALLIEGARRVGKSYIVEEFGRQEYGSYVLIDFKEGGSELAPLKEMLSGNLRKLDDLFMFITVFSGKKLITRDTLIIFDEVQDFPRAREAIKFLVRDGRFDYIETGSLISIKENTESIQLPSEEEKMEIHPMDFEEFMWAMDQEILWEYIKKCYEERKPLEEAFHRQAMLWFRKYLIVGGMPQAVLSYAETGDFIKADHIKRNIISLYRDDIRKHDEKRNSDVGLIFDGIPSQLSKQEKKYTLSKIKENAEYRNLEKDFFWLQDSKIVNVVYNSTEPNIGLSLTKDGNTLKCFMGDTGLLISMAFSESRKIGSELYRTLLYDTLAFNDGMIIENVVSQMLIASGHRPFYFSSYSNKTADDRMEIDFLIAKPSITAKHNIIPIEVKSGKNYTFSSLKKMIRKYKDYLSTPCVIHERGYKEEEGIIFLPIYMTPLL